MPVPRSPRASPPDLSGVASELYPILAQPPTRNRRQSQKICLSNGPGRLLPSITPGQPPNLSRTRLNDRLRLVSRPVRNSPRRPPLALTCHGLPRRRAPASATREAAGPAAPNGPSGAGADAKAPGGQDGYRAGGLRFRHRCRGLQRGGPGGPERVGLHAGTWGGPLPGTWGRSPYRGPGGRSPWGNGHGGMAGGRGETRPPRGEEGTRGNGGQGRPPIAGRKGFSPARYGGTGREAGAA